MTDTAEILPATDDDVFDAMLETPSVANATVTPSQPPPEKAPEPVGPSSETIPLEELPPNTQNLELIDGQYYHNGVLIPEDHAGHPTKGERPWSMKPGHKPQGAADPTTRRLANRVNVREVVGRLKREYGLDPIECLYYVMVNSDETRALMGWKSTERISPNLQAKAAMELLAYMAPKLKSVEVKTGDTDGKPGKTHIFLPNNERNTTAPLIHLPEKDGEGKTFQLDPETAVAIIDAQGLNDDEEDDGYE